MEEGSLGKRPRPDQSEIVDPDIPAASKGRASWRENITLNDGIGYDDPVLGSRYKVFLSHSGAQKDFVEILCRDLESQYRFPFFDKRPDSLPKGGRFSDVILKATQQCKMAVVVVSEEYFMSKWPMIELHSFVQARSSSNSKLKILPLFYGLSVRDITSQKRNEWLRIWEGWAKDDSRIKVHEWKEALDVLMAQNGLEYNSISGVEAYLKAIVSTICQVVPPDIKWDDSHVQGREDLCQAIYDKIQQIQRLKKNGVCFVGIYGVGGIGKTTICKALCNDLLQEFEGNVCHIEMGARSNLDLLKTVLRDLTNASTTLLDVLNDEECQHILRDGMSMRKTFLAVDNVWDDYGSIEAARIYLRSRFHEASIVVVTSRTLKTLTYLGLDISSCMEMPKIGDEDARRLFVYHAAPGRVFSSHNDKLMIGKCVALCYFGKGDKKEGHYLPLALKVLGVQLGCLKPSQWLEALPEVKDFNYLQDECNPVFSILRTSFDKLKQNYMDLFMDVAKFAPMSKFGEEHNLMEWLSYVHRASVQEIELQLQCLKDKGLLEDVDVPSQKIIVHDLYQDFAKLECQGKVKESSNFEQRRWVYNENTLPTELESQRCWESLSRLGIVINSRLIYGDGGSLDGIEWEKFLNVRVLKLVRLQKFRGGLDLSHLKCLISIELVDITALDSLEGLQDLKRLTYFRWIRDDNSFTDARTCNSSTQLCTSVGQFPSSLKVLELCVGVQLRPDAFARCTYLFKVTLSHCQTESLDFNSCSSLEIVKLHSLQLLRTLVGLTSMTVANLDVSHCRDLVEIQGLDYSIGLQRLRLYSNRKLKKLPNLQKLTKLEVIYVHSIEIGGLGCLLQLRELTCTSLPRSVKPPSLYGFQKLRAVSFCASKGLSSLEGVFLGGLPELRSLELGECVSLVHLPDLSLLTNLEELGLCDTGIEFREKDICMLATLPRLRPVRVGPIRVGDVSWHNRFRLDVVRRKVLEWIKASEDAVGPTESWLSWTKWEERDLGELPIENECICGL